jgi:hypothetical protein
MRDLHLVRRELVTATNANEFLKRTLGEMTIAITAKDRQIDSLQHSRCKVQDKAQPSLPTRPDRKNVSESGGVRADNSYRSAATDGTPR